MNHIYLEIDFIFSHMIYTFWYFNIYSYQLIKWPYESYHKYLVGIKVDKTLKKKYCFGI